MVLLLLLLRSGREPHAARFGRVFPEVHPPSVGWCHEPSSLMAVAQSHGKPPSGWPLQPPGGRPLPPVANRPCRYHRQAVTLEQPSWLLAVAQSHGKPPSGRPLQGTAPMHMETVARTTRHTGYREDPAQGTAPMHMGTVIRGRRGTRSRFGLLATAWLPQPFRESNTPPSDHEPGTKTTQP